MCLDCGCGEPENDHGDERHITMSKLQAAADASGTTVQEVANRIFIEGGKPPLQGLAERETTAEESR